MDAATVAAIASIVSALIAVSGTLINQRKTEEASERARQANDDLSRRLREMDDRQQSNLALLKSELDRFSVNYSKRVEVLTEAYARLAQIKILMKSHVVPMFSHSKTGDRETLMEASHNFVELYKYCSMKEVFLSPDSRIMRELGDVMANINIMLNNEERDDHKSWKDQARVLIDGMNPILSNIREEVRDALKLEVE